MSASATELPGQPKDSLGPEVGGPSEHAGHGHSARSETSTNREKQTLRAGDTDHDVKEAVPGFAPDDLDDGRALYSPRSRWTRPAKIQIAAESLYLLTVLATTTWVSLALLSPSPTLSQSSNAYLSYAVSALVGGGLGGSLFAIKWLYHVVAKGLWNADRLLWRIFTPLVSGATALSISLFVVSGILIFIDTSVMTSPPALLSTAVLIGYFSDNAIAALAGLAERIFGPPSGHRTRNMPER
jgi:hypothetical protein